MCQHVTDATRSSGGMSIGVCTRASRSSTEWRRRGGSRDAGAGDIASPGGNPVLKARESGNAAFRAGKYKEAIDHYTVALGTIALVEAASAHNWLTLVSSPMSGGILW